VADARQRQPLAPERRGQRITVAAWASSSPQTTSDGQSAARATSARSVRPSSGITPSSAGHAAAASRIMRCPSAGRTSCGPAMPTNHPNTSRRPAPLPASSGAARRAAAAAKGATGSSAFATATSSSSMPTGEAATSARSGCRAAQCTASVAPSE